MTRNELNDLFVWLKTTYPKKYDKYGAAEEAIVKDNLSFAYEKYTLKEIMPAYRFFLDKTPFEPTSSEIKAYVNDNRPPESKPVLDDLPEHHYMRGRYIHSKAWAEWQKDHKAGIRGKKFKDYVEKFPEIEWVLWGNTDDVPNYWRGVKYTGWERTAEGFIKPKGAPNRKDLTLNALANARSAEEAIRLSKKGW